MQCQQLLCDAICLQQVDETIYIVVNFKFRMSTAENIYGQMNLKNLIRRFGNMRFQSDAYFQPLSSSVRALASTVSLISFL